jgi:hypothetical protein
MVPAEPVAGWLGFSVGADSTAFGSVVADGGFGVVFAEESSAGGAAFSLVPEVAVTTTTTVAGAGAQAMRVTLNESNAATRINDPNDRYIPTSSKHYTIVRVTILP